MLKKFHTPTVLVKDKDGKLSSLQGFDFFVDLNHITLIRPKKGSVDIYEYHESKPIEERSYSSQYIDWTAFWTTDLSEHQWHGTPEELEAIVSEAKRVHQLNLLKEAGLLIAKELGIGETSKPSK